MNEPVVLWWFYSEQTLREAPSLRNYALRVQDLLEEASAMLPFHDDEDDFAMMDCLAAIGCITAQYNHKKVLSHTLLLLLLLLLHYVAVAFIVSVTVHYFLCCCCFSKIDVEVSEVFAFTLNC